MQCTNQVSCKIYKVELMVGPLAYILLKRPISPDLAQLVTVLRQRYPDLDVEVVGTGSSPTGADARPSPLLKCSGRLVAVMSIEAPLPIDEHLIARASILWPGAGAAFRESTAHLIVTIMGQQEHLLPAARMTTAIVDGLLSLAPDSLGVVWDAEVAQPPQFWAEMGKDAFAPYPRFPVPLWVGIHPFRDARTGGVGIVTQGLRKFVDRELELISAAGDLKLLMARTEMLAAYLIERGPVLTDGSTFGISEAERIPVRLCPSERFAGLPVISGSIAAASPQHPECRRPESEPE
ncbi:DUF4261 domain-containing protein [Methylobacterium brachiatum]|uniref:DUF4261 domain-containing protein n=1 Tax=Methylobacterium brachiatum TaxID=269660 RepID=UPI002448E1BB|nr:DUF4261 domain-containing protein [Methylobacterium brachiatum]MDH2312135.1 DUF4261 domain-containing protein [Methylobacterium brachiatum]